MKRLLPFLLLFATLLSCNLPGQGGGEPTEAATAPAPSQDASATPAPLPTEAPTEIATSLPEAPSPTPANCPADLCGQAHTTNAPGEWPLYDSGNSVYTLLLDGETLWAGTSGGMVRWNTATGEYQRFTAAEGFPLTAVFDLAAKPDALWAVGIEGAAVFDGTTWQHIPQADMGLPDTPLRAVAFDGQGTAWVGGDEFYDYGADPFYIPTAEETQGGLAHLTGDGTWEHFDVVNGGLLSNQINDLTAGSDGSLWVASGQTGTEPTPGGISRRNLADGAWTHFTIDDGLDGFAFGRLAFDATGILWAGGRRGISYCQIGVDGSGCRADSPPEARWQSLPLFNVQALSVGPDGTLWLGALGGLQQFRAGVLAPVAVTDQISINAVIASPAAADEAWLGTDASLTHLQGETLTRQYTADGPLHSAVLNLAAAEDGSLWLKTPGGVSRLAGDQWQHYFDERAAAEAAYPWPLNRKGLWPVDSAGGLWLKQGAQLERYDGTSWTDVSHPEGEVYILAADPTGGMWGVNQTSLIRYLDGAWQTVASIAELEGFAGATDLLIDSQGGVWLASAIPYIDAGGVFRWDGGSGFVTYTEAEGLAGNATGDLALAPDGQLWAAHSVRGLSRFDGSAWQVEVADPRALGLEADGFNAIIFVDESTAWFRLESHCGFEGTCFSGLARKSGDNWTAYHAAPGGLPTDYVLDLAIDNAGQVWVGTGVGLVKLVQ